MQCRNWKTYIFIAILYKSFTNQALDPSDILNDEKIVNLFTAIIKLISLPTALPCVALLYEILMNLHTYIFI